MVTTARSDHSATDGSAPPWAGTAGLALLTFAAAGVGGIASARAGEFYAGLVRPGWAPPAWLFGPVWTLLYGLMAVAATLVWRHRNRRGARWALAWYVAQLALNALWTWLFFRWRLGGWAFAEVLVLTVAVAGTAVAFHRVSRPAGWLLLPYLAWVTFASVLTLAVWRLNPERL